MCTIKEESVTIVMEKSATTTFDNETDMSNKKRDFNGSSDESSGSSCGERSAVNNVFGGTGNNNDDKAPKKRRKRAPKPLDMPKRPMSAYNLFFKAQRNILIVEAECADANRPKPMIDTRAALRDVVEEENRKKSNSLSAADANYSRVKKRRHRKTHGKIGFQDLARIISRKWKVLDEEERAIFEEAAEAERVKYRMDLKLYHERKAKTGNVEPFAPVSAAPQEEELTTTAGGPEIPATVTPRSSFCNSAAFAPTMSDINSAINAEMVRSSSFVDIQPTPQHQREAISAEDSRQVTPPPHQQQVHGLSPQAQPMRLPQHHQPAQASPASAPTTIQLNIQVPIFLPSRANAAACAATAQEFLRQQLFLAGQTQQQQKPLRTAPQQQAAMGVIPPPPLFGPASVATAPMAAPGASLMGRIPLAQAPEFPRLQLQKKRELATVGSDIFDPFDQHEHGTPPPIADIPEDYELEDEELSEENVKFLLDNLLEE